MVVIIVIVIVYIRIYFLCYSREYVADTFNLGMMYECEEFTKKKIVEIWLEWI